MGYIVIFAVLGVVSLFYFLGCRASAHSDIKAYLESIQRIETEKRDLLKARDARYAFAKLRNRQRMDDSDNPDKSSSQQSIRDDSRANVQACLYIKSRLSEARKAPEGCGSFDARYKDSVMMVTDGEGTEISESEERDNRQPLPPLGDDHSDDPVVKAALEKLSRENKAFEERRQAKVATAQKALRLAKEADDALTELCQSYGIKKDFEIRLW